MQPAAGPPTALFIVTALVGQQFGARAALTDTPTVQDIQKGLTDSKY